MGHKECKLMGEHETESCKCIDLNNLIAHVAGVVESMQAMVVKFKCSECQ